MNNPLTIYFDGSYSVHRNARRVGLGFVAFDSVGVVLHFEGTYREPSQRDSTIAEFMALEAAIKWAALDHKDDKVFFVGDNASVIQVMRGEGHVRTDYLKGIHARILVLMAGATSWRFEWKPREMNGVAHWLAHHRKTPEALPAFRVNWCGPADED